MLNQLFAALLHNTLGIELQFGANIAALLRAFYHRLAYLLYYKFKHLFFGAALQGKVIKAFGKLAKVELQGGFSGVYGSGLQQLPAHVVHQSGNAVYTGCLLQLYGKHAIARVGVNLAKAQLPGRGYAGTIFNGKGYLRSTGAAV